MPTGGSCSMPVARMCSCCTVCGISSHYRLFHAEMATPAPLLSIRNMAAFTDCCICTLVGYIQGPPGCLLQPLGWRPKVEPIRVSSHETDLWRSLHRSNLSRLQYHACGGDFPNIWPPVRIFKSAECPLLSVKVLWILLQIVG